jgi:hypothetical protein
MQQFFGTRGAQKMASLADDRTPQDVFEGAEFLAVPFGRIVAPVG